MTDHQDTHHQEASNRKRPLCVGNWKMNKGPKEAVEFCREFLEIVPEKEQNRFALLPPAIDLVLMREALAGSQVRFGAQNCYFENSGAFTGENSPEVLAQVEASFCLVGHSERRQIFNESDEWASQKVKALQAVGVTPILCVGETLEQREGNETNDVVLGQLREGLKLADSKAPLWVAYEPVWAIGTGRVATPELAQEVHQVLRQELVELWGQDIAQKTPFLYGGSVKPENSADLFKGPDIDGFLVGGASLDPKSLAAL